MTQVIYRNDGQGNIQVLPIQEADMPQPDDTEGWTAFYKGLTAQYCSPDFMAKGEFLGKAKATLYRSLANYWAVFGLDIKPGIDDHTIRFVRFAYRNTQDKTCWPAPSHPPMEQTPDIARDCVSGWDRLDDMPTF